MSFKLADDLIRLQFLLITVKGGDHYVGFVQDNAFNFESRSNGLK